MTMNELEERYSHLLGKEKSITLKNEILRILVSEKHYRDPGYTAKQLASDIGTNVRYISAAIRIHFHTNYASMVNKMRVDEAISMMTDDRYRDLNVEDIGYKVGFVHRQSFVNAFKRVMGIAPKHWRMQLEANRNKQKK